MESASILCVVIRTRLFLHLLFSEHLKHSRFWAVRKQEGVLLSTETTELVVDAGRADAQAPVSQS